MQDELNIDWNTITWESVGSLFVSQAIFNSLNTSNLFLIELKTRVSVKAFSNKTFMREFYKIGNQILKCCESIFQRMSFPVKKYHNVYGVRTYLVSDI